MSTERTAPGWKADRQTAAEGSSGAGRLKRMCVGFPGSSRYRISTPDLSGGHEIYRPVLYNEGGTADFRPSRSENRGGHFLCKDQKGRRERVILPGRKI